MEDILTLFVIHKGPHSLEAKILGHELANLLKEACKTSLRTHFRRQLQSVNHSLFLHVYLLFRPDFFNLHREIGAHYFHDLLVCCVEAYMFVLLLYNSRLALDHEHDLLILENYWVGEEDLVFETIFDLIDFLESG